MLCRCLATMKCSMRWWFWQAFSTLRPYIYWSSRIYRSSLRIPLELIDNGESERRGSAKEDEREDRERGDIATELRRIPIGDLLREGAPLGPWGVRCCLLTTSVHVNTFTWNHHHGICDAICESLVGSRTCPLGVPRPLASLSMLVHAC